MIENPFNSHFWMTTPMQELCSSGPSHAEFVSFHDCCHGGDRDKLTSLWVNKDWLHPLRRDAMDSMHTNLGHLKRQHEALTILHRKKLHIRPCCVQGLCHLLLVMLNVWVWCNKQQLCNNKWQTKQKQKPTELFLVVCHVGTKSSL